MRKKDNILKAVTVAAYILLIGVALLTTADDIKMWQVIICTVAAVWLEFFYHANKDRWIYKMD